MRHRNRRQLSNTFEQCEAVRRFVVDRQACRRAARRSTSFPCSGFARANIKRPNAKRSRPSRFIARAPNPRSAQSDRHDGAITAVRMRDDYSRNAQPTQRSPVRTNPYLQPTRYSSPAVLRRSSRCGAGIPHRPVVNAAYELGCSNTGRHSADAATRCQISGHAAIIGINSDADTGNCGTSCVSWTRLQLLRARLPRFSTA